ncbi:MAG: polysaccharide biosynthesis tyrosine autokinase [Pyrinomonadaceae bacterium]|nr:polysaccharide biosynthesis tyrosine autokinase [Pyrinomonadaceae bacterium]
MDQDQRLTPLPRGLDVTQPNREMPATYAAYYDHESQSSQRTLRHYVRVVTKRLPMIGAIAIVVTAAAAFYSFRQPSIYSASAEMLIEPRKASPTAKDAININFDGDETTYYNTQIQLLQNSDLMKKVVLALGLQREPDLLGSGNRGFFASIKSIFSSPAKAEAPQGALPVLTGTENADPSEAQLSPEEAARANQYAAALSGGLHVEQTERTSLFTVTVSNKNPQLAADVANKVAQIFIDEDAKRELEGTQSAYDELTKSIGDLKVTIADQETKLTDYMRSSNLPLQEKGSDLAASRLQTLSEQWLSAADDRRKLEARYNGAVQASSRGEGKNIPDLYENKVYQDTVRLNTERRAKLQDQIRDIEKQIKDAETEKAELLVKYTPAYVKVQQVEEKISSLKATKQQTESEVSQIIDRDQKKIEKDAVSGALVSLRSQVDAAKRREDQLLNAYEVEAERANIQGQATTTLTTLKRALETNRGLLDTYTQRQKEQELALAAGKPNNIKISSSATVPSSPVSPNRPRNIFIALLASLFAGIGLAFLLDYLDDSVRTSDDVSRALGLPTLAMIPHHGINEKKRLSIRGIGSESNGKAASSTALITLEERHSPMAEAYRHLRTSLLFSSAGKPPQSILVTSSQPSEGKTTTAINTAITLAQADADVVLIDCDLRRPRMHSHFGLSNAQGLTNYLSGEKSTENLIKAAPGLPHLKIITSGPIPPNPAELLSSNEMRNLLQFLRGRFKHIIIDSPPAISFTDAAILSTQVDGVVLIAMAGKSSMHLMRQFRTRISALGARIYGVVLNGITSESVEYDYYGTGYYHYYKHRADDETPIMEGADTAAAAVQDQGNSFRP